MIGTDMEILAIIPARGGSRGIPKKNIKLLGGIPLIAFSIAAGLQARSISRVIVSTDDEEIAKCAIQYGAEVPFLRPGELAEDNVPDLPVLSHALEWLNANEMYRPDIIVQLRPTSPLRPLSCIDEAVNILIADPDADCVRAVTPCGQNPYKMWRIENGNGQMIPLLQSDFHEQYNMPRQLLPKTYWQTGQLEVIRRETIIEKHSLTGDRILPIIIDPKYVIDIDGLEEWKIAEHMLINFMEEKSIFLPGVGDIRMTNS